LDRPANKAIFKGSMRHFLLIIGCERLFARISEEIL